MEQFGRLVYTNKKVQNEFEKKYESLTQKFYENMGISTLTLDVDTYNDVSFCAQAAVLELPTLILGVTFNHLPLQDMLNISYITPRLTFLLSGVLPAQIIDKICEPEHLTAILPFKQTILPHYGISANELTMENYIDSGYADWFMAGWLLKHMDPRSASYSIFSRSAPVINEVDEHLLKTVREAFEQM